MKRQKSLLEISSMLAQYQVNVKLLNKESMLDINIVAEDLLIPILNLVFECNLINANNINPNFPAVDLIDDNQKIAIQVTSTTTQQKVNSTFKKFINAGFHTRFNILYILMISDRQANYKMDIIEKLKPEGFNFDNKNIIDLSDLFNKFRTMDTLKLNTIRNYLKEEIANFQESSEEKDNQLELKSFLDIKTKWEKKLHFLQGQMPTTSDINQQYTLMNHIEECESKIKEINQKISSISKNKL